MVIDYLQDPYGGYRGPVKAAVRRPRHGLVRWFENQAIRLVEIDRKLAFAILPQLVVAPGQSAQVIENLCSPHLLQPQ
jgi:hypothetical protein